MFVSLYGPGFSTGCHMDKERLRAWGQKTGTNLEREWGQFCLTKEKEKTNSVNFPLSQIFLGIPFI
jgi:hypothetical protein